jgi:serine/threonine-protein kinase
MRLIEGQLIHRRYRLDQRLAQGGMGEVWKAYDLELGRDVAIKALRGDLAVDRNRLQRLRSEAHNSANLAHPNIAALFEYYENDGIGFLVMEFVDSKSLAQIYKEEGTLSPSRLLPILIQTARGLYVAHSHGVIHRDVKPANIMVSDSGEVKITDFGVSYSTNQAQITQDGMVVGTAQYISPEQAQGEQATACSDIYSLGIVAYEGIAGHRPFTGATAVDIAAAQVNDPVPPLPDSTEPELARFVMSMLEKEPSKRPQNALEVSRQLSRIERDILDAETGSFPVQERVTHRAPSRGQARGAGQRAQAHIPAHVPAPHEIREQHDRDPHEPHEPRSIRSTPHKMKYHIHTSHAHTNDQLDDRDDRKRGSR